MAEICPKAAIEIAAAKAPRAAQEVTQKPRKIQASVKRVGQNRVPKGARGSGNRNGERG